MSQQNMTEAQKPGRRFMALGDLSVAQNAPNLTSSYVVKKEKKVFPDIYTTCPELRKFQLPLVFSKAEDKEESSPKKENITINNSISKQQKNLNSQQVNLPSSHFQQSYEIQAPNRPFVFQRGYPPYQILQIPLIQIFDPNSPIIRPHEIGFVPKSEWPPQLCTLWDLRQMYFTRRNGISRRFDFKLYNALCITKAFPNAYPYVGIMWIGQNIMKVHSQTFAHLLGIHAVQGGLFHKQGNFSRHGFIQVHKQSPESLALNIDMRDVDDYNVRLFTDQENRFSRDKEFVITEEMVGPQLDEEDVE